MQTIFDEHSCSYIACTPRDSSFAPRRVETTSFSSDFSEVDSGQFSWVLKSTLDDQDVALKVLKLGKTDSDELDFKKEFDILVQIGSHPNVMSLLAVCHNIDGSGIVSGACFSQGFVLPWHSGGNLKDFIKRHPEVIEDDKCLRNILLGVCRGVQALHEQKIVHRDIACRNFLVSNEGRVVLSDFGLSRKVAKENSTITESEKDYQYLYYKGGRILPFRSAAPESLSSLKFNMRSDVWSLGILAIHLAFKCEVTPFRTIKSSHDLYAAFKESPTFAMDQLAFDCPVILRYFVEKCCNTEPRLRPRVQELVKAAYISNDDLRSMVRTPSPSESEADVEYEYDDTRESAGYGDIEAPVSRFSLSSTATLTGTLSKSKNRRNRKHSRRPSAKASLRLLSRSASWSHAAAPSLSRSGHDSVGMVDGGTHPANSSRRELAELKSVEEKNPLEVIMASKVNRLELGTPMWRMPQSLFGKPKNVVVCMRPDPRYRISTQFKRWMLTWTSTKKHDVLDHGVSLQECRLTEGQTTKKFRRHRKQFGDLEHVDKSFTLRVINSSWGGAKSVNLIAKSAEDYQLWIHTLRPLVQEFVPRQYGTDKDS